MNLYSRDEITAFNTKLSELAKKISELDKDVKSLDTEIKGEDNQDNIANMKKVQMNKKLEKDELLLQIKNIKTKISATA